MWLDKADNSSHNHNAESHVSPCSQSCSTTIGTTDSKQQALLKTTDVDTYTLDFEDDFELEKEQMIGALIYSIHKVEKTKNYNN